MGTRLPGGLPAGGRVRAAPAGEDRDRYVRAPLHPDGPRLRVPVRAGMTGRGETGDAHAPDHRVHRGGAAVGTRLGMDLQRDTCVVPVRLPFMAVRCDPGALAMGGAKAPEVRPV